MKRQTLIFLEGRTTVREGYVDSWLLLSFFLAHIFEENWWETCAQTVCTHAFDAFVTVLAPAFTVYRDVFLIKHHNVNPLFSKWKDFTLPSIHFAPSGANGSRHLVVLWPLADGTGWAHSDVKKTTQRLGKFEGVLTKKGTNITISLWLVSLSPSTLLMFLPPPKKHVQWILRPEEEASWILCRSCVDMVELWITTSFLLRSYSTLYLLCWVVRVTGCHWQSSHEWEDLATKPQLCV